MDEMQIARARGAVEGYLEDPASGKITLAEALEAWQSVDKEYKRLRSRCWDLAGESAQQNAELTNLREQSKTAIGEPKNNEKWQELVSFEWRDEQVCFLYAHPDNGIAPFGIGATYLDGELRATLETPPFSVRITLPYLRAAVKALEVEAHRIPTTRPSSL